MLPLSISLRCLLRVWFMGAAMTTQGMQHIGLLFVLEPGLSYLYKDPKRLKKAHSRYLEHINTHPMMAPIFVGLILALENLVATHKIPDQNMQKIIHTTSETFSAIGDSFFSGSLIAFWALTTTLFIFTSYTTIAIIWTCFLLALLLLFRLWFFFLGLRQGLMVLTKIKELNLINQAYRLKTINSILIALIYWNICNDISSDFLWIHYFGGIVILTIGSFLVNTAHIPRAILASIACFGLMIYWFKPGIF